MNLKSQEYLAKLLAKENLTIQHGNYQTASFEPVNRILRLPLWEDKGKAVYDLLVGHEVGHALYTPAEGWHDAVRESKVPPAYFNIVEDIRIERKIQETYPGIVKSFTAGYKRLFDDNLFGTNDREVTSLMDKLNVHSKGRGIVPIEFDIDEQPLVDEAMVVQTWDDVVVICEKIHKFLLKKKDEQREETEKQIGSEGENGQSAEESGEPSEELESTEENGQTSDDDDSGSEDYTEAFTDDSFRKNEEELLETVNDYYTGKKSPKYSSGISKENLGKVVTSYSTLTKARDSVEYDKDNYLNCKELHTYYDDHIKKGLDSTANLLVKDFERKKAAYEYSRATVAKKGSLNMNKLHQYKYSEDIFLSVTKLAQAKSHGIVMFVDWSGSMSGIVEAVVKQAITVSIFCKKVNIPFDVYTFTTKSSYYDDITGDTDVESSGNEIEGLGDLRIVQVLSSTLKKGEFREACKLFWSSSEINSYSNRERPYYWTLKTNGTIYDRMGTTPLIQTAIVVEDIVSKFQRKYGVQKINIMFLTDGYADRIDCTADEYSNVKTTYDVRSLNFKGKVITGDSTKILFVNTLERLKELSGAKITGFFLAQKPRDFYIGCPDMSHDNLVKSKQKWTKEHIIAFKNTMGYDDYFIVRITDNDDEEFTVMDKGNGVEIKDIKREFMKFNRSKKSTRQLVNKITDAVAV